MYIYNFSQPKQNDLLGQKSPNPTLTNPNYKYHHLTPRLPQPSRLSVSAQFISPSPSSQRLPHPSRSPSRPLPRLTVCPSSRVLVSASSHLNRLRLSLSLVSTSPPPLTLSVSASYRLFRLRLSFSVVAASPLPLALSVCNCLGRLWRSSSSPSPLHPLRCRWLSSTSPSPSPVHRAHRPRQSILRAARPQPFHRPPSRSLPHPPQPFRRPPSYRSVSPF